MMHARRLLVPVAVVVLVALGAAPASASAATRPPTTEPPPPPVPAAYILVDADTGNVLAQQAARTRTYPASTIKLLTALLASERLPVDDVVPVSSLAESMPARKMNLKAGQQWTLQDLLHAMLMVSANDAAVAVAERIGGGSLETWQAIAEATAKRLGLADEPMLNDPAGLDDEFSRGGGTQISPRDLAIIGRAVLRRPDLLSIIQTKSYAFQGGDGIGHKLTNQDPFLSTYDGATGLKTGGTKKAGLTFVGSATRAGRTMLAVVFNGADPLRYAAQLLDQGFAMPVAAEPSADRLPDVVPDAALDPPPAVAPAAPTAAAAVARPATAARSTPGLSLDSAPVAVAILVAGLVLLGIVRRAMLDRYVRDADDAVA